MKIGIVGYGRMGQLIAQLAPEYGCEVGLTLDEYNNSDGSGITQEAFAGIPVAIEFSTPHTVLQNIRRLAAAGVNAVVGTTGWMADMGRVQEAVRSAGTGLIWSPNFSVGVNVFFRLVSQAARLMASEFEYGAWAWEIHHDTKKDAPSG